MTTEIIEGQMVWTGNGAAVPIISNLDISLRELLLMQLKEDEI